MRHFVKNACLLIVLLGACAVAGYFFFGHNWGSAVVGEGTKETVWEFNGKNAFKHIVQQVSFGDRSIAGAGHARTQEFIETELRLLSGKMVTQKWSHTRTDGRSLSLSNIGISFFSEQKQRIILFTHYDVEPIAFRDSNSPDGIVPGANNGASGVAVLLELARALSLRTLAPRVGVDILFFDGEEGERGVSSPESWRPIGSQYFADHLQDFYPETKPFAGIDIDMVCKKDLVVKKELTSSKYASWLIDDVWSIGKRIAPSVFSDARGLSISDDHTSLNAVGIPSILLIDFDYPPNYTTHDTPDTCSEKSLQAIGDTLLHYIRSL